MRSDPSQYLTPLTERLSRWQLRRPAWMWPWRRGQATALADYRDRISVATWVVVAGLTASLIFEPPVIRWSFWALGSPVSILITNTIWAAVFVAAVAAAGAQSVVTVHPEAAGGWHSGRTWSFWALPMAITSIAIVLLPAAPSPLLQAIGVLITGGLVALAYDGLYATVERNRPGYRRARLLLDMLAYGSALLLFLFVYQTRTRSLLSGSLVAVTAMLLAVEILRTATDRGSIALIYGGIVGLVLGEVTWALNYWLLPGLTGGLLLLLIFYLMVGIAQQGLQGRLTRRVLLEFGIFALIALILIAVVSPAL